MIVLHAFSGQSFAQSSADSAWFLDSRRTVNYCIVRADTFSLSSSEIDKTIQWALSTWASYMEELNLDARPQALTLARQFRQADSCDGADLQFLFGVHNQQIDEFKKQDFFHPVSFARRTKYNSVEGWSKGLIWISNENEFIDPLSAGVQISWAITAKFKAILLHELGHVFGVGHWRGTIMRSNILEGLIQSGTASDVYSLTHITNSFELQTLEDPTWKTGFRYNELGDMAPEAFLRLMGRAPQGLIRGQWLAKQEQILIQDDLGEYLLNTKFGFERRNETHDQPLFFASRKNSIGQIETVNSKRESYIKIGVLTSLSGEQINIILEKNTADRHLKFSYQSTLGSGFGGLFNQRCEMVEIPLYNEKCLPVYPKDEG